MLAYCRQHRVITLSATGQEAPGLFENPSVARTLDAAAREAVIDSLVAQKRARWLPAGKKAQPLRVLVLWRSVEDWAQELLRWARSVGLQGSVESLDEIIDGAASAGTELHGIDRELLVLAIRALESRGAATLFTSDGGAEGVKFA